LQKGKRDKEIKAKIINKDTYQKGENVSYVIDYSVTSTTEAGTTSKGSVYLRGQKSQDGGVD